jgi:trans-aconitate 2-methyltransferase
MSEWHANDYARQSSLQQAMADDVLGRLTLVGNERVLDVGCGDGKITAEIAVRVPRGAVVGVDPSRDMISFASSRYSPPRLTNVRFEQADARRLPFRSEFDLAVSFNALHWVPEQAAALRSIREALTPEGRATLRMVPAGQRESLEDVIEEVRQRPRWAGAFEGFRRPYVHFSPDEYRALAEAAGFRVDRASVEDRAWDFQTREGFIAFAEATFVEWTNRLPKTDWAAFITDVLDRYEAIAWDEHTFKFYQMDVALAAAVGAP